MYFWTESSIVLDLKYYPCWLSPLVWCLKTYFLFFVGFCFCFALPCSYGLCFSPIIPELLLISLVQSHPIIIMTIMTIIIVIVYQFGKCRDTMQWNCAKILMCLQNRGNCDAADIGYKVMRIRCTKRLIHNEIAMKEKDGEQIWWASWTLMNTTLVQIKWSFWHFWPENLYG